VKNITLSTKIILLAAVAVVLLNTSCGGASAPATTNSAPAAFNLITEKQFNELFPQRDKFYTYPAFIKAVKELGQIKMKITRRAVSVYQFMRTDKSTGKTTMIRQDVDWNEGWAKVKPDSVII